MPVWLAQWLPWLALPVADIFLRKWLGPDTKQNQADYQNIMAAANVKAKREIRHDIEDKSTIRNIGKSQEFEAAKNEATSRSLSGEFDVPFSDPRIYGAMMFPGAKDLESAASPSRTVGPPQVSAIHDSPELQAILARQGTADMANKLVTHALSEGRPSTVLESLGILA